VFLGNYKKLEIIMVKVQVIRLYYLNYFATFFFIMPQNQPAKMVGTTVRTLTARVIKETPVKITPIMRSSENHLFCRPISHRASKGAVALLFTRFFNCQEIEPKCFGYIPLSACMKRLMRPWRSFKRRTK
jgi:hypothetical protein